MKEQLLAELKELTENVSDTYDDFVYGINCTMKSRMKRTFKVSLISSKRIQREHHPILLSIWMNLEYKIRALLSVRLFSFAL